MNTDAAHFGGGHVGNRAGVETEPIPWHGQPQSAEVTLPPLATVWLVPGDQRTVGDEGTVVGREGTVGDGEGTVVGGERTGTDDQPVAAEEPPVSADELPVAPDAQSTHPQLP